MREMKNSRVSYIGVIPSLWSLDKIKYHLERYETRNPGNKEILSVYREYGVIPKDSRDDNHNVTSEDTSNYKYVKPGYFVINKMKAWQGSMGVSEFEGVVSPAYFIYRFKDSVFYHKYFHYLLRGCYKDEFRRVSGGIREGQWDLPALSFENTSVLLPTKDEQIKIVSFLDNKCIEIDGLTEDIKSQIDTLEAYKRSIITEAVTKGLDKNAEMKDSGMPWIGTVPNHWMIEKVKYHLVRKETKNQGDKQVLSVYREYGVIPKDSRDDNHNVTSEDTSKYKYVRQGNLVINKMKAWQGSMGVSDYEGIVSPAYFIYHFSDNSLVPKYLHYLFRSCYKDEFRRISGGIREGQWDLDPDAFANTMLLIPPRKEQEEIIRKIDEKTSEIEVIISQKQEQLEVLADYKKSLIYEYVTGKKEV